MAISTSGNGTDFTTSKGQELTVHGTPLFPAAFYNDKLEHYRVPWHWHDELEAVVIASGETTVSAGQQHYTLRAGQGFFVNANVLHAAMGSRGTWCSYHTVVFHPRLIGGGIDSVFWQNYLRPLLGSGLKSVALDGSQPWHQQALDDIESAWQEGAADAPGYEFRVRAALSDLIFLLSQHLPKAIAGPTEKGVRDNDRIKQMLRFIQENYAEEIDVSDIAKSAMISESECLRCFKGTIGIPPIQYVKRYRVQKAAELLGSTDQKIADIGALCGFQDTSYFIRSFREVKGMSPGAYRKMLNGE